MALPLDILAKAKPMLNKFKYNKDPKEVRHADGSLNFTDNFMDCSEFILSVTKAASVEMFNLLSSPTQGKERSGNTSVIKDGIKKIEKWSDFSKLKNATPVAGDWMIWEGHLEIVQEVTRAGRVITIGANGATGGAVPKNIDSKDFESAKKIAANYLGAWTPRLPDSLVQV